MRRLFTLLLVLGLSIEINAQSNEIEVIQVPSPIKNTNYNSPDSADIIIRIRNVGPSPIETYDSLRIAYSVSRTDTAFDFDTTLSVNRRIQVGAADQYTLVKNYRIEGEGTFSVCAEIKGTLFYPQNTSKFPGECSQFLVSVKKVDLKPSKVYFSSGTIYFDLNEVVSGKVEVFDITGKLLLKNKLKPNKKQSITFDASSKGFYFLKVIDNNGNNSTSKFIVN